MCETWYGFQKPGENVAKSKVVYSQEIVAVMLMTGL